MEVTEALQRSIVRERGFTGPAEEAAALLALRVSAQRHPEVAFWVRHNRARRGELRPNHLIPDVSLAPLAPLACGDAPVRLADLVPADGRPLAIIALSYS